MRQAITDLREKRAGLVQELRAMIDAAEAEGRDFNAEEIEKESRLDSEIDSLDARAKRMERQVGLAPEQQVAARRDARDPNSDPERVAFENRGRTLSRAEELRARHASDEYRQAFDTYLRIGRTGEVPAEVRAALTVGTDLQGGYTVPDEFVATLIESEIEFSTIRQLATVIQTADNGQVKIPTLATEAVAAKILEEGTYAGTEPTFGERVLDSYKYGIIVKIADELVSDSAFDISALVARLAGKALGQITGQEYVIGDGSGDPNGITTASTAGVSLATGQPTTITSTDSLIDLYHSVVSGYRSRPGAGWLMKDATVAYLRKFKELSSGSNQYLWQPGLQAGQPDLLLGKPVYTDPAMPSLAASKKVILFGDFSEYWIRDVEAPQVRVLQERYADTGQVGVRVSQRTDGELADTAAVKALVTSAT